MKLKNILLTATLALFGLAVSVEAQSPIYESFIGNNTYVILPWPGAGTTTNENVNITNQFFVKGFYQTNSSTYPYVSGWGPLYTIGTAFSDINLWANRDGTAPLACVNLVVQDSAIAPCTNNLLVTLTTINSQADPMLPGLPTYANAQPINTWSFNVSNTAAGTTSSGGDLICVSSNIPQGFLQGALGLRASITAYPQGTNSGVGWTNYSGTYYATNSSYSQTNVNNGWQLVKFNISGYKPVIQ